MASSPLAIFPRCLAPILDIVILVGRNYCMYIELISTKEVLRNIHRLREVSDFYGHTKPQTRNQEIAKQASIRESR